MNKNELIELRLQTPYMRGEVVTYAQTLLLARKFSPGSTDGIFGSKTASAVKAFQLSYSMPATGVVDSATWDALLKDETTPVGDDGQLLSFLAYLQQQVDHHGIYVWGAQGQGAATITEDWIERRETNTANVKRAITFWKKQVAAGYGDVLRAFDCSGLGMYWIQNLMGISSGDLSANGMKNKCKSIARKELQKGDWVFRTYLSGSDKGKAYHIGYIVDVALNVIEAKGRDDGVVKRSLDASGSSYWTAYGRPEAFFPNAYKKKDDGGGNAGIPVKGSADFATCTGGSVNLRQGPGAEHASLGIINKGGKLLVMPPENGWRKVAMELNGGLTTAYMSDKYIDILFIGE